MLLVQKFGGTSVADPERIRAVADHVARTRRAGDDVVVVVSAMGKSTDDLLRLAYDVAEHPDGRELDMLLTAGERISMALVSMAVENLGVPAMSFTGSQAGIVTDTEHNRAKIIEVKGDRIREALAAGKVAIVAGFQGVSTDREITTMGRGASDLTAVALAAALDAEVCEIYTDVEGVYSADPRIVPQARKLARVSFDEMLEMAATGGRVLALRSVEFARNHDVQRARSFELHLGAGHLGHRGGSVVDVDGAGDHLGRHARRVRGEGHDRAGTRPARCRRHVVPRARRRGRERRHDRAERVDRRPHRHLVHRSAHRPVPRRVVHGEDRRRDRRHRLPHRRADRPGVARSAPG